MPSSVTDAAGTDGHRTVPGAALLTCVVSAACARSGAAAFAAISWGAYVALFPGASSTQVIYTEAFERVQADPSVSYVCGSPLRAYGADHGGSRGRRNSMERWDVVENGEELSVVRFSVAGPQGAGIVQVQTPTKRKRGEFEYIIFENRGSRTLTHVVDRRQERAAERAEAQAAAEAKAAAAAAPAAAASG